MKLFLVHTKNLPIFKQLELEEGLLRTNQDNWCIINEGSTPSVVMGISGKAEELVAVERAKTDNIPIIKRFSGGGTVIVDESTLFVSFLFQKSAHPFQAYPEPIFKWSEVFYQKVFLLEEFYLRENDYIIGDKKCGGNAQYIKKDRWLHHTSFLWDYSDHMMGYLLHPKKAPSYRDNRTHKDFLCRIKEYVSEKQTIVENIKKELSSRYEVVVFSVEEALEKIKRPYRTATVYL